MGQHSFVLKTLSPEAAHPWKNKNLQRVELDQAGGKECFSPVADTTQLSRCCFHSGYPLTHTKNCSSFLTDVPPRNGGDKPRAHLTGNSPRCVFQETMDHGPEISFSVFAKTHSSSFKLQTTPLGNRHPLSVEGSQRSSFLKGAKGPYLLGSFFQILSALFLFSTISLFHSYTQSFRNGFPQTMIISQNYSHNSEWSSELPIYQVHLCPTQNYWTFTFR